MGDTIRTQCDSIEWPKGLLGFAALCVSAFSIFVFGYQFGTDDQLDILPTLHAMTEPGLYARDWSIQTVLQFNVREYYNWLLFAVSWPMGLPASSFLLYVVTVALLFAGVAKLAHVFLGDCVDALVAAAIGVLSSAALFLGYSKLLNGAMLPNLVAYTLTAWSLYWATQRRHWPIAFALGFAILVHALVGLQGCMLVAATYFAALLHHSSQGNEFVDSKTGIGRIARHWIDTARGRWRSWVLAGAVLFAIALPNLVLTFRGAGGPSSPADETREFLIWAEGRIPHHILPHSWPGGEWYALSLMLIAIAAVAFGQRKLRSPAYWCPLAMLLIGLAAGAFFVEVVPVALIAKLMPFRGMCFVRVFWAIAIVRLVQNRFADDPAARGWMLGLMAAVAIDNTLFHVAGSVLCFVLVAPWRPVTKAAPALLAIALAVVVLTKNVVLQHETKTVILAAVVGAALLAWRLRGREARPLLPGWVSFGGFSALGVFLVSLTPWPNGPLIGQARADSIWHACRHSAPDDRPRNAYQRFGDWASRNTPRESLVLVAPWMKDFRYRSRRAVVVDARKVPYSRQGLFDWQQRLFDICGIDGYELRPGAGFPDLISAFRGQTGAQLAATARRYGATYAALDFPVGGPWRLIHQDKTQRLYELIDRVASAETVVEAGHD